MTASANAPVAVIMAGGSGTRFWPLSRSSRPKQLVSILAGPTMIQATVARLQPYIPADRVLVITTAAIAEETRRQLPMLKPEHVIAEPVGRDTAACVALAAMAVERSFPGAPMILLPADQVVQPADRFQQVLAAAADAAADGSLVCIGIQPRFAATGYGYIEVGDALAPFAPPAGAAPVGRNRVVRFVEKPDAERAAGYVASGRFRWNAGIFAWRTDVVLAELAQHCPWLVEALRPAGAAWGTPGFPAALAAAYGPLKKISIDYALLEKAKRITVVTGDMGWDDLGSWDALYDHLPADADGNRTQGETLAIASKESLLVSSSRQLVVAIGVENLSVVATPEAVLVTPRGRSQDVKLAQEPLKTRRPDLL